MKGWTENPLGELLEVQNGYAFNSKQFSSSGGVPLIRIRDLYLGTQTETRYTGDFDPKYLVRKGDLLIGMDGEFRCNIWHGPDALLNQRVCRLQNFSEQLLPRFLWYGINGYLQDIEDKTGFTTVKHLSSGSITAIEFPSPPIPEQERIVAILDEAFAAIATATANAEKSLSCAGGLLVSKLAQVFGTPNPTWVQAPVAELAAHSLGKMLDRQKNRGEFHPYLRNQSVRWFGFDLSGVSEMRFEESEREKYTAAVGDLLICEGGYPGRAAIWPGPDPIHFQKAVHRVRFHEPRHTKWFLYFLYYLDSSGDIRKHFTGTGIQHLTGRSLARVVVPIPPSEQIAAYVASFDAMRSEADRLSGVYERRVSLLTELKQSILHKAFTGELTADFNAADVALSNGEV